ncbi:hypothetical protein PRZ48_013897 [Zasmidium cellare]|uniref:Cytochrome P450 n=1 Tax=Zasmidium cellare TaxID=395010 RepID=A0ABR0DZW4_ZASCE|nr:hypothetical protein PRZ48_013897 [Zasmidium cellare]
MSTSIHWRSFQAPNEQQCPSSGNVVRIAPNDLSFNTPEAARDIYYHVINGRPKLLKSEDYKRTELASMATVRDVADHRRQRSSISKAFSTVAAREKQGIIDTYAEKLVHYLQEHGCGSDGLDVIPVYTWLTPRLEAEMDLFDYLIADGVATREELISQSMIFLAAGSGTVQSALTGATFYLLKNPQALEKLQEEVRDALESVDEITDQSTSCMPYLNAVIQEGLRLFPPLPSRLPRVSPGAIIDGHYVPKGAVVSATTYDMSRDSRYWYQPDEFWPERWISSNDRREASKPFSTRPRACIGVNLALLEMRLVLARLVYTFNMESVSRSEKWDEGLKVYFLWKKPPLRVRFTPIVGR